MTKLEKDNILFYSAVAAIISGIIGAVVGTTPEEKIRYAGIFATCTTIPVAIVSWIKSTDLWV